MMMDKLDYGGAWQEGELLANRCTVFVEYNTEI